MTRALLAALLALLALAAPAAGSPRQEAMFQDDDHLTYPADDAKVERTLDELRALGVDRVRITVVWRAIAPGNDQDRKPAFDAADPTAYPPAAWANYDRVIRLAAERGIGVNLNVTAPAPDWATGSPEREDIDDVYAPDPVEFGNFVKAVATRYSEVDYWSLYNEPNQGAWLSPQWVRRDGGAWEEAAPRLYRELVDAAWTALQATGHGDDTILIGETAPKGLRTNRGETRSIDALRFLRRLYCVDDNLLLLRGRDATQHGCPTSDAKDAFPREHPALFEATGYAHHPYELIFAPTTKPSWPDWATTGNLPTLQSYLRRLHGRYDRRGGLPLYLTEYGYQTNPPDRVGVTWAQQAAYLNQAEYIAYRNPGVRALAQFLLVDGGDPVTRTFQTGLRTNGGKAKPSHRAYRFPIHVVRRGRRMTVWGLARPAPRDGRPRYTIEFRRRGSSRWRRIASARGSAGAGYVTKRLRAPGNGAIRLRWEQLTSRAVTVPARHR
ncbi:MAG TPA: cellulase family glycosylhydrolase [Solirubrobacteraceae bacterium]|nr:cellulase family glycosylhydrolase [Solirubrobacteraceae bacterium]